MPWLLSLADGRTRRHRSGPVRLCAQMLRAAIVRVPRRNGLRPASRSRNSSSAVPMYSPRTTHRGRERRVDHVDGHRATDATTSPARTPHGSDGPSRSRPGSRNSDSRVLRGITASRRRSAPGGSHPRWAAPVSARRDGRRAPAVGGPSPVGKSSSGTLASSSSRLGYALADPAEATVAGTRVGELTVACASGLLADHRLRQPPA
jgi:hypothetical protein